MFSITIAAKTHADPDRAHDPATEMCEEPISFTVERADSINLSRWIHQILIPILEQLVGVDNTTAEEVDGVIFLHVHAALTDRFAEAPLCLDGDNLSPGAGGAIEGEEEVKWPERQ
uniref:Uncharacterized protein n=1 Tax=Arundo donax TaxID=35708 RepID=A0A0A8Y689_ARUDO